MLTNITNLNLHRLTKQLDGWLDYGQPVNHVGSPFRRRNATHQGTPRLKPFYPLGAMRQRNPANSFVVKVHRAWCQERPGDSIHSSTYHLRNTYSRKRCREMRTGAHKTKLWNEYIGRTEVVSARCRASDW